MNLDQIELELNSFLTEYEKLANKKNFNEIKPFISEDAIYWFSDGSFNGIDEIEKAFESTWNKLQNETYTISELRWLTFSEDQAICIYNFKSVSPVDGKILSFSGRGTNVLKKINMNWKIIHEHLSLKPDVTS